MNDLIIDPNIRGWVFLPIILITFLVGIFRHYVAIIFPTEKPIDVQQIQDNHILLRSKVLRQNGKYIPRSAFAMRREAFNNPDNGYLTKTREQATPGMMTDPDMMIDLIKGNITNVIPMFVIGGWINWMFSGFITTKVPFPLTLRFKSMLQRGIGLLDLEASWVSSASWYFLNVFGLRSIYSLVLSEGNEADFSKHMQDQMVSATSAGDTKVAFKAEWEALEITEHTWILQENERSFSGNSIYYDDARAFI